MNRLLESLSSMHDMTRRLLKRGMALGCLLMLSTVVILFYAGPYSSGTYLLHRYANLMFQLSFVVLLETVIGTALVEERLRLRGK